MKETHKQLAPPAGRYDGYPHNGLAPDEEITRIGPGTPAGEYLRRFWHPIALSSMVGALPLKLPRMGGDLVLYPDKSGNLGLLHLLCCHHNASLEFGIIESCGIRGSDHGWLFGNGGTIRETPGEPATSQICNRVTQGAYPVIEYKQMIFASFGPVAAMPPFPFFDTLDLPDETMVPYLLPSPCNWVQIFENGAAPYQVTVLHTRVSGV
jgi:phenylpropionate dioxygenase-like ring-hydroxylating dioxygenase large terminal subunit